MLFPGESIRLEVITPPLFWYDLATPLILRVIVLDDAVSKFKILPEKFSVGFLVVELKVAGDNIDTTGETHGT